MLENVREELIHYIDIYGLGDARTVRKSQELDLLIVKEMETNE